MAVPGSFRRLPINLIRRGLRAEDFQLLVKLLAVIKEGALSDLTGRESGRIEVKHRRNRGAAELADAQAQVFCYLFQSVARLPSCYAP